MWAWGNGTKGQLGLGTEKHQLLPALVGHRDMFSQTRVVMMSAGHGHAGCVAADGAVWTWGDGSKGCLGHGNEEPRPRPTRCVKYMCIIHIIKSEGCTADWQISWSISHFDCS